MAWQLLLIIKTDFNTAQMRQMGQHSEYEVSMALGNNTGSVDHFNNIIASLL